MNIFVIVDSKGVLVLVGIFGGEVSGVNEEIKDVVLEVVFFVLFVIMGCVC